MDLFRQLRPVLPILLGASVALTLAMGLRQSLGIFMPSAVRDIGITVADFTLAVAVQNLAWGILQPFAGALAVRIGFGRLMLTGSVVYLAGLVVLSMAQGVAAVIVGAGIGVGAGMACAGPAIAMGVAARAVSAQVRSTVLGMVSAAGSLGAMIAAPIGQLLMQHEGWRVGVAGFAVLALVMLPAARFAGRVDAIPLPAATAAEARQGAWQMVGVALRNPYFVVMTLAYFVCGMQLIFLTTHLPAYLDLCGMDPMLSAQALGLIGAFNVLGSLFFGWAGGRWNKQLLLGLLYCTRSCVLAWYFITPPTPGSTLLFASIMGFLWLGVSPLIQGWIADTFGVKWQAMIGGVAFVWHQLGSFAGAYGGGLLFVALGNYSLAWKIGVSVGLAAGITQALFALKGGPPRQPPPALTPA